PWGNLQLLGGRSQGSSRPSRTGHEKPPGTLPVQVEALPGEAGGEVWQSSAASQFGLDREVEIGLVKPAAGIGGALPALQRDGANVVTLLVIENLEVSLTEVGTH